ATTTTGGSSNHQRQQQPPAAAATTGGNLAVNRSQPKSTAVNRSQPKSTAVNHRWRAYFLDHTVGMPVVVHPDSPTGPYRPSAKFAASRSLGLASYMLMNGYGRMAGKASSINIGDKTCVYTIFKYSNGLTGSIVSTP
ncbi:hypothetical protein Tco_1244218, partial [Tanacetum coccineum]